MFNSEVEQKLIGNLQELAASLNYIAEHKNDILEK